MMGDDMDVPALDIKDEELTKYAVHSGEFKDGTALVCVLGRRLIVR